MEICTNEHPIRFTYNNVPIGEKKTFPKDMHAEYEMLLFLEGGFSYVVEDRKYPVMPYTLILVPPNTYHFAVPKGEGVYCRYMLAFKAQAVDADLPEKAFAQSGCYQLEENHPVVQAFRQLHAMRTGDRPDDHPGWRRIPAKKRFIDPYVMHTGRISALDAAVRGELDAFLREDLTGWICSAE